MPWERAVARIVGNRCSQKLEGRAQMARVEPHVGLAGLVHPAGDRLGDDVARREIGQLVDPGHQPAALPVDQEGALATYGLGDQRLLALRVGSQPHHGRVELHELQVTEPGTGAERERHAVSRGDGRVRGLGEHLTEPAAGQDHGAAEHAADAVDLALAEDVEGHTGHATTGVGQEVDCQRVLDDLDLGRPLDRCDQRPLDLRARGVPTGVGDPVAEVAALTGERQDAVVLVEDGAPADELVHGVRPFVDQDPHGFAVTGPGPGDQRVVLVLRGGVTRAERGGDPALRPLRRAGVQHVLGDDQDPVDLAVETQGGSQAGDAGPDDDDVGAGRPAGLGRLEPRRDHQVMMSPRVSVGSSKVSAGSCPVAMTLLSSSTKTTCGTNALASAVSIWP